MHSVCSHNNPSTGKHNHHLHCLLIQTKKKFAFFYVLFEYKRLHYPQLVAHKMKMFNVKQICRQIRPWVAQRTELIKYRLMFIRQACFKCLLNSVTLKND